MEFAAGIPHCGSDSLRATARLLFDYVGNHFADGVHGCRGHFNGHVREAGARAEVSGKACHFASVARRDYPLIGVFA
ncbi:MAG: hypothetical protein Q7S40_03570 [Opitutaceae bacterium]|nr:hypothetical protein [Opitutaceae bacterium]